MTQLSKVQNRVELQLERSTISKQILLNYKPQIISDLSETQNLHMQSDTRTQRITKQFGYDYFKMEEGYFTYYPIPNYLQELGQHVSKALRHKEVEFSNVILSLYNKGYCLEPHEDKNVLQSSEKSYYFDENVYGVIIEADPSGHLYFVYDEVNLIPDLNLSHIIDVKESVGTCFCLNSELRQRPYFHGVSEVSKRRISVTFRRVIFT